MSDTTESPETVAETETIPTGDQQPHPADVIAALQAEIAGLKDQALRALAEAENTRRRAERDREDASKYAVSSFARDLLSVADNLRSKALVSIGLSMLGVILYLGLRFDFQFGLAATVATFHDVLIVLGICWLLDMEMTLLIITALLTLAGYSLNDTVVIFDRIRENMAQHEDLNLHEIINISTNQVLARSIITVLTVLFTVVCLYLFGGATIHDFSFALLIGLLVGTYSSIFVASPLLSVGRTQQ